MAKNESMNNAKKAAYDEFYTQFSDIEAEILQHEEYINAFADKTVYCNCDDPEWSNFVLFFQKYFEKLKLKSLITSHINLNGEPSYATIWSGDKENGIPVNISKIQFDNDGDFRSDECVELLKKSDIVVTNPPFSIFREFISLINKYNKQFIILGNMNAISYKEFFKDFQNNKVFVGYNSGSKSFRVSNDFTNTSVYYENELKYAKFGNVYWFTNIKLKKSNVALNLTMEYNKDKYPKYDNYDAIECKRIKDIPKDYFGEIGVPISFMSVFCPKQFEIVGKSDTVNCPLIIDGKLKNNPGRFYIDGCRKQERVLIKRITND